MGLDTPEEFFPIHLVQFAVDVPDRVLKSRYDDVLDGVHSSIRCTDDLVKDSEGCLERSDFDKGFDGLCIGFFCT